MNLNVLEILQVMEDIAPPSLKLQPSITKTGDTITLEWRGKLYSCHFLISIFELRASVDPNVHITRTIFKAKQTMDNYVKSTK